MVGDDWCADGLERIEKAETAQALEAVRVLLFGRKGRMREALARLKDLPANERPAYGARVHSQRLALEEAFEARSALLADGARQPGSSPSLDYTLPARPRPAGRIHPLSQTSRRICDLFVRAGYSIAEGPEVESDHLNFSLLNFPPNHPARQMHDTFYVDGSTDYLLRTHTSPVQLRAMMTGKPPLRVICPGKVYRSDHDVTHSPMFHQIEGLLVDEGVSFADLKGTVVFFLRAFFEDPKLRVRFRPSYFPFTEPSAEVDIWLASSKQGGKWLEVMGCGLTHPVVLENGGIDSQRYSGFAFGLGVERMAMLRYQIHDLRLFFRNDIDFLRQFA